MNATVRCKFLCGSIKKTFNSYEKQFLYDYEFRAVTSGSEENKKFFKWTPSGVLNVTSVVFDQFEVGKEYYLDISEVSVAAETPPMPAPPVA